MRRSTIPLPERWLDEASALCLRQLLEAVPGVGSVFVGLQTEMVHIVYDPTRVELRYLRSLIETAD
jgi:hypothetical protein